jgi:methionine aminopeptidase
METIKHYKLGKDICQGVYSKLKQVINDTKLSDVSQIISLGNDTLTLKLKDDGEIFIPVCISLNDCISFYSDEQTNLDIKKEYSLVRIGDVVKIEMGVIIEGCMLHFGETFIATGGKESRHDHGKESLCIDFERVVKKLNEIPKRLCKKLYPELDDNNETRLVNDDISNFITAECTKFDCYPVENAISYKGNIESFEAQTENIILGFKQKFDDTDEWILLDNPCYDIQNGDVFNLNITIVPERETDYMYNGKVYKQNEHVYIEPHSPHLYRFTGETHQYKLKSVREFINAVKPSNKTKDGEYNCLFNKNNLEPIINKIKTKLGLQYTVKDGVVNSYPVVYLKRTSSMTIPVFFKKCTVYMWDNKLCLV